MSTTHNPRFHWLSRDRLDGARPEASAADSSPSPVKIDPKQFFGRASLNGGWIDLRYRHPLESIE
jgi:hypothetical protein